MDIFGRAALEQLLSPFLSPACAPRLWSEAWQQRRVTPTSLWAWSRSYGDQLAALAVAAGLTETQLQQHLSDRRLPDREALEMLADLNCFPHVTPDARPLAVV